MTLPVILAHTVALIVLATVAAGLLAILPLPVVYVFGAVGIMVGLRYVVKTVTRLVRVKRSG